MCYLLELLKRVQKEALVPLSFALFQYVVYLERPYVLVKDTAILPLKYSPLHHAGERGFTDHVVTVEEILGSLVDSVHRP